MADEKEKGKEKSIGMAKNPIPKKGVIDINKRVKVVATKKAPYHKEGEEISCSPTVSAKMLANGWAVEA